MKRHDAAPGTVRVAIYARQSIDEGDVEFRSVDAQRDGVEAYVASQRSEGWKALPENYNDAGYSGGDLNRPGFKRLMSDVEAGRIDVIAVHRIDRLSRSLADFVSLLAKFERHAVTFVSVTQAFNTSTSAGRLMLNVLASFAEFERATISERTKDKMLATRKRGMWAGGNVPLGYDLKDKKLVVNEDEAEQVRAIYRLYLERGSLLATVDELNTRGWRTKSWVGRRGKRVASYVYSVESLRQLLSRVVYIGLVRSGKTTYPGLHERIVDQDLWDAVQAQKRKLRPSARNLGRNKYGALLKGLITCGLCGSTMDHAVSGSDSRRYQYYGCNYSRRMGRRQCAGRPVPVRQIDEFVVERVRAMGRDPRLLRATAAAARAELEGRVVELEAEVRRQEQERRRARDERTNLVNAVAGGGPGSATLMARVGELDERLSTIDGQLRDAREKIAKASTGSIDEEALAKAMADFDGVWSELFAREKQRVLSLLIEKITFASDTGDLSITFRTTALTGLGGAA